MNAIEAFDQLKSSFPKTMEWRGLHLFSYVEKNGVLLLERKKDGRFYYVIFFDRTSECIHSSLESRFKRLKTVGETLTPSRHYD